MFYIEGAVTKLTRQLDDAVCNAIPAALVRVNRIHNPSRGVPLSAPIVAQDKGAKGARVRDGCGNGLNG